MKFLLCVILLQVGSITWCHFVQKYYERGSGGNYEVMKETLMPYPPGWFLCEAHCTTIAGCISFDYDSSTEICTLLREAEGSADYTKKSWARLSK